VKNQENRVTTLLNHPLGIFFFYSILYFSACFFLPRHWDHNDGFMAHATVGIATRDTITHTYIYGMFGISDLLRWLQQKMPDIAVYGWTVIFLYWIGYGVAFVMLYQRIKDPKGKQLCFFTILFFAIITPSLFKPNSLTGLSIILCGATLPLLYALIKNIGFQFKTIALLLVPLCIYLIGFLCRQETALAASIIVGVFIVINTSQKLKAIIIIFLLLLPGLAITHLSFNSLDDSPFLKQTEGALYYVADGGLNGCMLDSASLKDSMKMEAVASFFINDEEEITVDFIQSMAKKKISCESNIKASERIERIWNVSGNTITQHLQYVLFNFLFLIFVLVHLASKTKEYVLFQVFFWVTIFVIAYTITMEDRHYIHLSQIYTFCNLCFIFHATRDTFNYQNRFAFLYIAALGGVVLFSFFTELRYASDFRQNSKNMELVEAEINQIAKNKILLLDKNSKTIFFGAPTQLHKFDKVGTIAYFNMAEMPLFPEYEKFLSSLCNCNPRKVVDFYQAISKMGDKVIIVSADNEMEFLQSYLKIVHNKDMYYNKVPGDFYINRVDYDKGPLFYYTIKFKAM